MDPSMPKDLDEYSASATTIEFDFQIPLLRGPIPAAESDDPSSGPYFLAFRNPQSWATAYKLSESKIISQCEGGARIGCAISASQKCKPPWWRNLIGWKVADLKEKENCEEREMEGCLVAAKEKCVGFAKEKCFRPFSEARIAVGKEEVVKRLMCLVSVPEKTGIKWFSLMGIDDKCRFGITNQKASELLAFDPKYTWFFKQK
ncbi:uncharacterized protein LOC8276693 [Ricinus communis]|uniref:uncharacterized protein LOC8276693 n=1 Tax=Ricinus communis TaxID=3988 RepID=UPI00201AEA5D|nr:uncharacterized protein LOC8276693 [Ricinus communis]